MTKVKKADSKVPYQTYAFYVHSNVEDFYVSEIEGKMGEHLADNVLGHHKSETGEAPYRTEITVQIKRVLLEDEDE